MKSIYKYNLDKTKPGQKIEMPDNAQILKVAYQENELKLWALVDTNIPKREYYMDIFGTGWNSETDSAYIDTVFDDRGFVWHIFVEWVGPWKKEKLNIL